MTNRPYANQPSPLKIHVEIEHWPLKEPFIITGHRFEASAMIAVTVGNGAISGRGEGSGVYYRGETPERMKTTIEKVSARLEAGIDRSGLIALLPAGGARNAIDCALWDFEAKLHGRPAWALAGLPSVRPLLTTWTVGAATPQRMAEVARGYVGCRAIKLKLLGDGLDGERVQAVRAARPDVWLGVDANQGFTPGSLRDVWPVFLDCDIKLVEQPFPLDRDVWMDTVDRDIPFGADESLQTLAGLDSLAGRFEVVNIKLDKCGGLTEGLEIARRARDRGLKVMVGNMTGTSLGMAPALVLGQLCDVVDLDGPIFLARDRDPAVHYADGHIGIAQPFWGGVATT